MQTELCTKFKERMQSEIWESTRLCCLPLHTESPFHTSFSLLIPIIYRLVPKPLSRFLDRIRAWMTRVCCLKPLGFFSLKVKAQNSHFTTLAKTNMNQAGTIANSSGAVLSPAADHFLTLRGPKWNGIAACDEESFAFDLSAPTFCLQEELWQRAGELVRYLSLIPNRTSFFVSDLIPMTTPLEDTKATGDTLSITFAIHPWKPSTNCTQASPAIYTEYHLVGDSCRFGVILRSRNTRDHLRIFFHEVTWQALHNRDTWSIYKCSDIIACDSDLKKNLRFYYLYLAKISVVNIFNFSW